VLLGIGLVHALLVWEGDILVWYALCGFLLLAFQKCKPRTLLIWAAIFLLIPALLVGLLWALLAMASLVPEIAAMIRQELIQDPETAVRHLEESIRVYAVGSYGEIFLARLGDLIFMWLSGFFFAPTFLGMFLVGLYAGRRRIFKNVTEHVALLRRVLGVGLAVGVPANLFYTFSVAISGPADVHFWWLLGSGVVAVGGPVLAGAYVAAITLLLQRGAWKMVLHPFAAAGQMALSNYLLQSLVCTSIFYSYGLGLFGSVGRMVGLGLAVIIFGAQVLLSTLWLKFFRNGPMEWLWRSLTYGKRQPLRR
jgi:uncharacterized protein